MIKIEHGDEDERSTLWADVRLFALTWGAGFVFTLIFFS
jgi:hypothetical protein